MSGTPTSDTLISPYERRIHWTLTQDELTDVLDAHGWEHGVILSEFSGVELWLTHAAVSAATKRQLQPTVGGANAPNYREASASDVGLVNPWFPNMHLKSTHAGSNRVTLVLHRSATLDPLNAKTFEPVS